MSQDEADEPDGQGLVRSVRLGALGRLNQSERLASDRLSRSTPSGAESLSP